MAQAEPWRGPERPVVTHRVEISARTILTVATCAGAVWLLNALTPILVVIVVALMLVGTLHPAVGWMARRGVERRLAIAVVFLACGAVVAATALITVPALLDQLASTVQQLPHLQQRLAQTLEPACPTPRRWRRSPV